MRVYLIESDWEYATVLVRSRRSESRRLDDLWDGKLQPEPGEFFDLSLHDDTADLGSPLLTDCPRMLEPGLLLSARAVHALRSHLAGAGVLFPTHGLGGGYQLFHCQRHLPAIDWKACIVEVWPSPGYLADIQKPVFAPEAIGTATLFRDQEMHRHFFATDAFVTDVERHGLLGFRFRLAWSSDDGPCDVPVPIPIERIPGEFDRATRAKRDALRARVAAGEASLPA